MIEKPRAVVSWSGGKDSCLALHRARQQFEVGALVTMFTEDGTRSRSHGFPPRIVQRQVELLGLELICGRASWETYETQLKRLLERLRGQGYTHVVFGDILLAEHKQWVERVCSEVEMEASEPLWGESTTTLVQEFLQLGGQARIVAVKAGLIEERWLGQPLSAALLLSFGKLGIDPCGENGEFHTLVTQFPGFRSPLRVRESGRLMHDGYWMLDFMLED